MRANSIQRSARRSRGRLAPHAWTISSGHCFIHGCKKPHILTQRLPACAARPAKHTRSRNRVKELRAAVAVHNLLPHALAVDPCRALLHYCELNIALHESIVVDLRSAYTPNLARNSDFSGPFPGSCKLVPTRYSLLPIAYSRALESNTASALSRSSSVSTPIVSAGAPAT